MKNTLNSIVISVAKSSLEPYIWKKHNIQNHHESQKTLDWNYKLQLIMKIKRFNCDQCGKNFARAFNLQKHTNSSWFTKNTGLKLQITLPYCSWRCFDFPQIKYEFWNNI